MVDGRRAEAPYKGEKSRNRTMRRDYCEYAGSSGDGESELAELLTLKFQQCSKTTLTYQLASASVVG